MLGIAGRIGRENSLRSPRRMAQTAAALIVGLAAASWPARRAARLDVLTALSAE
jgi:ABC-type lipoprotein release transport system permease subunit